MIDPQAQWYARLLPLREQVVVDVGANVGKLSQLFWDESRRTSRVVSIEPLPENAKAIEARIRASKAGSRWTVKRCAISSRDGHLELQPLRAPWGANSMVPVAADAGGTIKVACRTLEGLVPDATIVKVDVEGHEYAFLPQAVAALPNVRAWAVELHHVEGHPLERTLTLFADHGYRLIGAGARRSDPSGPWVDVDVTPAWTWDAIPGVPTRRDGMPSEFKMMHIIAIR